MATRSYWIVQEVQGYTDQEPTGSYSIHEHETPSGSWREQSGLHLGQLLSVPGAGRWLRVECGAFAKKTEAETALTTAPDFAGYRSIHNY